MKIHLTGGFLGSGKTTAIRSAYSLLIKKGKKVGVVSNDQGISLVDGLFFDSLKIPARQVVGGCFCCNFKDLESHIRSLTELDESEIIFAESVGSCTDIVATVMKPLLEFNPGFTVSVSIFADASLLYDFLEENTEVFSENVRYIYFKQLEEAGFIVINKIDLIDKKHLKKLKQFMEDKYPGKILLYQNSLKEDDIELWLKALNKPFSGLKPLQINYDRYGDGEARLGWLDEEIEIYSHVNNAWEEAGKLMQNIFYSIRQNGYAIGHLKFLLAGRLKFSFTSTTQPEVIVALKREKAFSVSLLINARVETAPENLSSLVSEVFKKVQAQTGCSIHVKNIAAFQPGFPRPTYRLLN